MKIFVTGSRGMLGTDVMEILAADHDVLGCDLPNCDLLDSEQVEQVVAAYQPDAIIHTAAYTNVDQAETEQAAAQALNEIGARNIAVAARRQQARLLYISTDYVFDGAKTSPYTEDDPPCPLGVYGLTKLQGERQVQAILGARDALIVRTAWLYGHHGKNFVSAILHRAQQQPELQVVNDQIGSPTFTRDLACGLQILLEREGHGIFHVTNDGQCSWYDFARAILEARGLTHVRVQPISTADLQRPAPRPAFSVLDTSKFVAFTGQKLQHWKQGLRSYLNHEQVAGSR
jgi:dTDP-4-dehydrorhamnose reductase